MPTPGSGVPGADRNTVNLSPILHQLNSLGGSTTQEYPMSSSEVTLGYTPKTLRVTLVHNAGFSTTLTNEDGDWPATATIELRFEDDSIWAAEFDGPVATFAVDKAVSNAVPSTVQKVQLWYVDLPADLCWAKGTVVRA